jgi:hypothetical protein
MGEGKGMNNTAGSAYCTLYFFVMVTQSHAQSNEKKMKNSYFLFLFLF